MSRWQELLLEIRNQKIALGSVMESAVPLGMHGDVIRIGCANDFELSSIKRHRELLCDIVQKVFNSRARVEPEVTTQQAVDPPRVEQGPASRPTGEEHPVIRALVRELGAEPLQ